MADEKKKRFVIFGYESSPAVLAGNDGTVAKEAKSATYNADVYMSKKEITETDLLALLKKISESNNNVILDDGFEFISSALSENDFSKLKGVIENNNTSLTTKLNEIGSTDSDRVKAIRSFIKEVLVIVDNNVTDDIVNNYFKDDTIVQVKGGVTKTELALASVALRSYELWLFTNKYFERPDSSAPDSSAVKSYNKLKDLLNKINNVTQMGGSQARTLRKKMSSKQRRGTQRRL